MHRAPRDVPHDVILLVKGHPRRRMILLIFLWLYGFELDARLGNTTSDRVCGG